MAVALTHSPVGPAGVPGLRDSVYIPELGPDTPADLVEFCTHPDEATAMRDYLSWAWLGFVGSDMCRLITDSAKSLPADTHLPVEAFPSSSGFVVFEEAIHGVASDERGEPLLLLAVQWMAIWRTLPADETRPRSDPDPEIAINFYSGANTPTGLVLLCVGGSAWPLGVPLGRVGGDEMDESHKASCVDDRSLLAALLLLIQSPGVVDVDDLQYTRQQRRQAERKQRPLDAVRIINLRGRQHAGRTGVSHEYHHRWIVSGHWRSQPFGPGRTRRKQVWIAPHIKGPEGAPMLTGEKVRVL